MVTRSPPARVLLPAMQLGLAWLAVAATPTHAGCSPPLASTDGPSRAVTATDIIELSEIGYPDASLTGPSPLAVSPDGSLIAFVLSRADTASNSYCRTLLVVPLAGGQPRVLDSG